MADPIITSNGGGNSANVNVAENKTAVTTVKATDADKDAIFYSIAGADAALFQINATTGVPTFKSAPDFENPLDAGGDNVYDIVVKAFDGVDADTQTLAITVTNVTKETVTGDGDANTFLATTDTEAFVGLGGTDTVSYENSGSVVTVNLGKAAANVGAYAKGDTYSSIENILGSNFNDEITGDKLDNTLSGNFGNDILRGGLGNDTLDGFDGTDTASFSDITSNVSIILAGGTATAHYQNGKISEDDILINIENLIGGSGNDSLRGDDTDNVIEGGLGNDILTGGEGAETQGDTVSYAGATAGVTVDLGLIDVQDTKGGGKDTLSEFENLLGSAKNDVLTGDGNGNKIEGGAGDDILTGGGGTDTINGGAGNDVVQWNGAGGGANDIVDGGDGIDTTNFSSASGVQAILDDFVLDLVHALAAQLSNIENAVGSASDDYIRGTTGANKIDGGAGNDTIEGGLGDDVLIGGAGVDIISFDFSTIGVTFDLAKTTAQITGVGKDKVSGFENIGGSSFADVLIGDKNANSINGGKGNDFIQGGLGADQLSGGDGNDFLRGGLGDDDLFGGDGNDTASFSDIKTGVSANLNGGNGTATYLNGANTETDTLDQIENLIGGSGHDSLEGDEFDNVIEGGAGNDEIKGDEGVETIGDTVSYASATAGVTVNIGLTGVQDTKGAGKDTIIDIENILGSAKNDVLTGDSDTNKIDGGAGDDTLAGGAGVNELLGGLGNDLFMGGDGIDAFFGEDDGDPFFSEAAPGIDTVSYASSGAAVSVNLYSGKGTGGDAEGDSYTEIENVIGSNFDDVFVATSAVNKFEGGAGNDTVSYAVSQPVFVTVNLATGKGGFAGITNGDIYISIENVIGDWTNDLLIGSSVANRLEGGAGDDVILGGLGSDVLIGGNDIDTVSFADIKTAVTLTLAAGSGNATYLNGKATDTDVVSGFQNIIGGKGNDTLTGDDFDNVIEGGLGNDMLNGGENIELAGDTLSYAGATAGVTVNLAIATQQDTKGAGKDTLSNFENLTGSTKNDVLTGDSNANIIDGSAGDDVLKWSGGADVFNGGTGTDTLDFTGSAGGVANLEGGVYHDNVMLAPSSVFGVENLIGSAVYDSFTGSKLANKIDGGMGDDIIDGHDGNDILIGGANSALGDFVSFGSSSGDITFDLSKTTVQETGAGKDTVSGFENVWGGNFDDLLIGDKNANEIRGNSGNDILRGGLGDDDLRGGLGNDTASFSDITTSVSASLSFGDGSATYFNAGKSEFDELSGIENLIGGKGNDTLTGDDLDNVIEGGLGNDTLAGGEGNETLGDTVSYANATAAVTVSLAIVTQQDTKGGGKDTITNFENIRGSAKNDMLTGDGIDNQIDGGAGNDVITGAAGKDFLTGGLGNDTFVYAAIAEGNDTIMDFASGDKIQIDKSGFGIANSVTIGGAGLNNFADEYFTVDVATKAHGQFVYDTTNHTLSWDADGTGGGAATLIATFDNDYVVNANDFILIA